ncbi:hypothetical protein EV279_2035 [Microbacterium sp. BK668]|nr:hypothetical protein EV279_2035 [Microbacterium sp. BK668]
MLRLDPAHPPLWRDASTLQFGLDAVAIVEHVEPWQERLVHELEQGVPPAALDAVGTALGGRAGEAEQFVERIRRALATPRPADRREVVLQVADTTPHDVVDSVVRALSASGVSSSVEPWAGSPAAEPGAAAPVILIAQHVVVPRQAAVALGRDLTHLPLVFGGASVQVGPVVRPGRTACLACVAAHRIDADPAWPHLAAQLVGRRAPAIDSALVWEAGLAAARLLSDAERHPERRSSKSVTIHAASGARTTRTHRPHAACRCRSLSGIAMAPVHEVPATMTARAYARPA